jgi:para-nitrobenzyl esterase
MLGTYESFNAFRKTRDWNDWDRDLSNSLTDMIVAFAKTGNPSTAKIKFTAYNPTNEMRVDFGDTIKVEKLNTKAMDFIDQTPVLPPPGAGRGRGGAAPPAGAAPAPGRGGVNLPPSPGF